MFGEKQEKRFAKRISEFDDFTTEKEIETEFYSLLKEYYQDKYTDTGGGRINYTAPHNIDGLLEVRTLDTDYRILVEAKTSKNFTNSKIRNEVLAQAIYYCRKLNHYGELIPAVIILLEKSSMIVIDSEELTSLIETEHNWTQASSAHKTDEELIKSLNNSDYSFNYYNFTERIDYGDVLNSIDELGLQSLYTINKVRGFKRNKDLEIFNEFTKTNNNIRFYNGEKYKYLDGKWFTHGDGEWMESSLAEIQKILLNFIKEYNYTHTKVDLNYIMGLIKAYYTIGEANYLKFSNCIVSLKSGEIIEASEEHFYAHCIPLEYHEENVDKFNVLSFKTLFNGDEKIFIRTSIENHDTLMELAFLTGKTIGDFNTFSDSDITVFDDAKELNSIGKIITNPTLIVFEELTEIVDFNELCNKLCHENYLNESYIKKNIRLVEEWNENNDMMLTWWNLYFDKNAQDLSSTYVTFNDLWMSYNELLLSRGNVAVSMRIFMEKFSTHSICNDNNLTIKRNSRILKGYERSVLYPSTDDNYTPKADTEIGSYVLGLKFKN